MDTKNKPSILMLITEYGGGGAERVFFDHSRDLAAHFKVTECTFNDIIEPVYETTNPRISLEVDGQRSTWGKIVAFLTRVHRLRALKKTGKFDVCVSHMEGPNYVSAFTGKGWKKIFYVHGSVEDDQNIVGIRGWIRRNILMALLYRSADKVVCVSDGIRDYFLDQGLSPLKVVSLPNYFDITAIKEKAKGALPEAHAAFFAHRPIVNVARLSLQKNQMALLALFRLLRNLGDYRLALVGDGPRKEELIRFAKDLGLVVQVAGECENPDAVVNFVGFQENPHAFVSRSRLLLLTSFNEGFPLVICEAMTSGTAVASVDCPTGPRQILAPTSYPGDSLPAVMEFGLLLPKLPADASEETLAYSAQSIHAYLQDETRLAAIRDAARKNVARNFSSHAIIEKLVSLIQNC